MNNKPINAADITAAAEKWSKSDLANHAAAVVLRDTATGNEYYHFAGETNEIAKCVSGLMKADPESVVHILSIVIATGCEILPVEMVQSICSETFLVIGLRQKGMSDDEIRDYITMIKD